MNKTVIAAVIAAAAVFGGVWYIAGTPAENSADAPELAAAAERAPAAEVATAAPATISPTDAKGRPLPTDPRLIALMVTPDDALIDYVKGPDGRVIQELDNDPNSARYRQPVREYIYAGGNVAGLTTYRSVGGQVEVSRVMVSYKPDGSIDQYTESVDHEKLVKRAN